MCGVNHTEGGDDTTRLSYVYYVKLGAIPKLCNILIGESHLLCFFEHVHGLNVSFKLCLGVGYLLEGLEEVLGDSGDLVKLCGGASATEKLCYAESVVIVEFLDVLDDLCILLLLRSASATSI